MSGAAGLSAARRRRAGGSSIPSSTGAPPPPSQRQTQSRSNTPHPMQILQDHEMRLRKIEPLVESLGSSSSAPESQAQDLTGIMARIVALETEAQKRQSDNNNESLSEMFMKLQTFALETNTLVLKMQTRIDELETQLAEKEEDTTSMVAVSDVGQELQVVEEDEEEDDQDGENNDVVSESDS